MSNYFNFTSYQRIPFIHQSVLILLPALQASPSLLLSFELIDFSPFRKKIREYGRTNYYLLIPYIKSREAQGALT
jgi:hypothetical protein